MDSFLINVQIIIYRIIIYRHVNGQITRMKNESMQKIVQKYCKEANIYRHCNVHLFRKTLATKLYKKGMDVSKIAKILGHHSVKTTELYYLTVCEEDVRYTYKSLC